MYKALVEMYNEGEVDFSEVISFNLDEYYGLAKESPQSYYTYMHEQFFKHINLPKIQTHIPDGTTGDVVAECLGYEEKIRAAGGIDLQVLGIGGNGHVGFNEPNDKLNVLTHLVDLSEKTIRDNSRFFKSESDVPRQALSVGIATIMKARQIVLLASGKEKAEAIKEMTDGYVNTQIPASILQTHANVSLIIDRDAAALL
jgi:glucosamine-6-phosphate deaminase